MPSKKLSLYGEITSRYGALSAVDSSEPFTAPYYLNGYFESQKSAVDERKLAFVKRPGFQRAEDFLTGLTGLPNGYVVYGVANDMTLSRLVIYTTNGVDNKVYFFNGLLTGGSAAPAAAGTWTLGNNGVVFTQLDGVSYGASYLWVATDFTKGALIDNIGAWIEITDADFTGLNKVTNIEAMDGYLFIGTSNNRIYNSDLNTPTSWAATSFLTAADIPGNLLWLKRMRNYLVAFKQHSIEFFEDTGNPTPGSPLTAQKQLNRRIGLASRSSVKEVSDGIIFMGQSVDGHVEMFKLMKDSMEIKSISNQYMNQLLGQFTAFDASYSVDPLTNAARGESQVIHYRGKEFYLITLRVGSVNRTYVYDNGLDTWVRWASCITGDNVLDNTFTPTQSVQFVSSATNVIYNLMIQNAFTSGILPSYFVTIFSTSSNCADSRSSSNANTYSFPLIWVSEDFDFGTRKRKFMDSLEIVYDSYVLDAGSTGTFSLTYRDTSYNSTSPNVAVTRSIPYSKNNNPSGRAKLRRLGSFRSRNFVFKQTDGIANYPFRLWGMEIEYNTGETDQDS